jgi:hypothetical protein
MRMSTCASVRRRDKQTQNRNTHRRHMARRLIPRALSFAFVCIPPLLLVVNFAHFVVNFAPALLRLWAAAERGNDANRNAPWPPLLLPPSLAAAVAKRCERCVYEKVVQGDVATGDVQTRTYKYTDTPPTHLPLVRISKTTNSKKQLAFLASRLSRVSRVSRVMVSRVSRVSRISRANRISKVRGFVELGGLMDQRYEGWWHD